MLFLTACDQAPSDAPIEYETIQFQTLQSGNLTEFQGPSTPKSDAAWGNLLDGKKTTL